MKRIFFRNMISSVLFVVFTAISVSSANEAKFFFEDELPFLDVSSDAWYFEYVKYTYDNFLTAGISEDTFAPLDNMTRAMFVTIIGRLYGARGAETDKFDDVEPNSWYSGYVGWAVQNNIVNGFPDKKFHPDEPVTREQSAAIIGRRLSLSDGSYEYQTDEKTKFKDADKVSDWAIRYLEFLSDAGILKGDENGYFRPRDTLSRAEAATVVTRLDKLIYSFHTY